ncbi:hypothetical protein FHG87_003633 [Trinorchestia longiramus]|nr:hypothetical protein FHG87_003633 [Trinorchestia longiramus]
MSRIDDARYVCPVTALTETPRRKIKKTAAQARLNWQSLANHLLKIPCNLNRERKFANNWQEEATGVLGMPVVFTGGVSWESQLEQVVSAWKASWDRWCWLGKLARIGGVGLENHLRPVLLAEKTSWDKLCQLEKHPRCTEWFQEVIGQTQTDRKKERKKEREREREREKKKKSEREREMEMHCLLYK